MTSKPIRFKRKPRRRLGSRRHTIGRVRWKLFHRLREAGLSLPSPDCLWMQEGFYRHNVHDLARWGADWRDGGHFYCIYSWDTMTDCVRYGITASDEGDMPGRYEISALIPQRAREDGARNVD
jgi:hypothetical protein